MIFVEIPEEFAKIESCMALLRNRPVTTEQNKESRNRQTYICPTELFTNVQKQCNQGSPSVNNQTHLRQKKKKKKI